ncbi:MAG: hypothetical protein PVF66_05970 [Candidatus Aminicenantes bacterium]|jgi:hypothetical protein
MKTLLSSLLFISFLIVSLLLLAYLSDEDSLHAFERANFYRLDQSSESVPVQNSFEKKETPDEFELTYGWRDHKGKNHSVNFSLSKQQLADAEDEFGYYPGELRTYLEESVQIMRDEMMSHLTRFTTEQILASKYARYISMDNVSLKDFSLKLSAPPSLSQEAKVEFARITDVINQEKEVYLQRIEKEQEKKRKEYLETKGFRFTGDRMDVNYRLIVLNNRPRIKQVVEAMRRESGKKSLHQFLALMLAFIQEIRYGIPPLKEEDKIILEFWVPPKVLVSNFGDCDSKGVTLASLWTSFKKYPFLLIKIPKHLFVGVAIPSVGGGGLVINGIRYTLCEVTGPDLIPPGLITQYSLLHLQGGNYRYELIK